MIKIHKLISADDLYGPFNNIETLADRYIADGCDLQFAVIGESEIIFKTLPDGFKASEYELVGDTLQLKPVPPVDPVVLASLIAEEIAKTYKDVDAIIYEKIGERQSEYDLAEHAAWEYKEAGFPDDPATPVSPYITGYAISNATGQVQTNRWSAEQILAQATQLRAAQLLLRNTRFNAQKAMRASTAKADLTDAVTQWHAFINGTRVAVGLPTVF